MATEKSVRSRLTAGDALLATYIAGCFTISLTIPYESSGFAGIPGESFKHIASTVSPTTASVLYFVLFFSVVLLSGARLLIGTESMERNAVFEEALSKASRSIETTEQWIRVACVVFAESLLIFAKLPGMALFNALAILTVLVLLWDLFLAQAVRSHTEGSINGDWNRLVNWIRTDLFCAYGLLIGLSIAWYGQHLDANVLGNGDDISSFDILLIAAATVYGAIVLGVFLVEIVDHIDIYKHSFRIVPLSAALVIMFVGIVLLSGGHFPAISHKFPF